MTGTILKWRNINSAPRDGSLFLAFVPSADSQHDYADGYMGVASWDENEDGEGCWIGQNWPDAQTLSQCPGVTSYTVIEPTVWAELPDNPNPCDVLL